MTEGANATVKWNDNAKSEAQATSRSLDLTQAVNTELDFPQKKN